MKKTNIYINLKLTAKNLLFYLKFSWKLAKGYCLLSLLYIIVSSLQPFILLILPARIIDELSSTKRWHETLTLVLFLIIIETMLFLLNLVISYFSNLFVMRSRVNTWMEYDRLWARMDYEHLENSNIRDLGSKVEDNVSPLHFIATVSSLIVNLIQVLGYAYIITQLHPLMVVLLLLLIGISSGITKVSEKLNFEFQPILVNFGRKINYLYKTMIDFNSGKEIRINNLSSWLKKRYNNEVDNYMDNYNKKQKKEFKLNLITTLVAFVQMVVTYGYCVLEAVKKNISVGSFAMYLGAITAFVGSVAVLSQKLVQLSTMCKYVDEFRRFYELTMPRYLKAKTLISNNKFSKHEIEFCDVSFKYPNTDTFVLKHINIKISCGEKLSIVGYNGAGKTTFIKLLCRLYVPTQGKILYNGIDIQSIDYDEYRELISVVFQDFQLFSMTVKDNIILNRDENNDNLTIAIEKSGLSEKINDLPKGIDTNIDKLFDAEGIEFSGGERQKLACARAYYRDTPIVILDEPTASLDPVSEYQLYQRFYRIMNGKTAIYISHRLASVHFCDNIAVFVDGEIVEYGKHQELVSKKGVYSEMYLKQSQYYTGDLCSNHVFSE